MQVISIKNYNNKYIPFKNNNAFNPKKPNLPNKSINLKELGQKINRYLRVGTQLTAASLFIGATTIAVYHEMKKQQKNTNDTPTKSNVCSPNTIQETRDPMAD